MESRRLQSSRSSVLATASDLSTHFRRAQIQDRKRALSSWLCAVVIMQTQYHLARHLAGSRVRAVQPQADFSPQK